MTVAVVAEIFTKLTIESFKYFDYTPNILITYHHVLIVVIVFILIFILIIILVRFRKVFFILKLSEECGSPTPVQELIVTLAGR